MPFQNDYSVIENYFRLNQLPGDYESLITQKHKKY